MKALVVYESMFGNTRRIAEGVAQGLASRFQVEIEEVEQASYAAAGETDLIVAGGPTHMWGMSRKTTRMLARCSTSQDTVSKGRGIREWLEKLPRAQGKAAAAFDTHLAVNGREPMGSAAHGIAGQFKARGYNVIANPQGFMVRDTHGPALKGELQHAIHWGKQLAWLLTRQAGEAAPVEAPESEAEAAA